MLDSLNLDITMKNLVFLLPLLQIFCLSFIKFGDGALIGYMFRAPESEGLHETSDPELEQQRDQYPENPQASQELQKKLFTFHPLFSRLKKRLTRKMVEKCNDQDMNCLINNFKRIEEIMSLLSSWCLRT